ncbi:DEKNAAC100248 [Brettanomyces naardenensis]|uniref:DEKNAAC100248 n=1 Tax=Brettanomyces naardenensis TaxID=13370 RepID=A0A448YF67_BRENA|nr:DEKNAAC100248 [Brettanomyces naardenensis]
MSLEQPTTQQPTASEEVPTTTQTNIPAPSSDESLEQPIVEQPHIDAEEQEPAQTETVEPTEQQVEQQQQPLQPQQQSVPASAAQGGRELSKTILYVGSIHKSVSEDVLRDLFSSVGAPTQSIKVLYDKNKPGFNYAFVEYDENSSAENALRALNGTVLANFPLKITWAYRTQQSRNADAYTLFVGDLSPEIDDDSLSAAFTKFPSFTQANVMWDMKTGRSRGYGFVSFQDSQDAEAALQAMNGATLGGRPIRLNWAVHRTQNQNYQGGMPRNSRHNMGNTMGNNMNSPLGGPAGLGAPTNGMPGSGMDMLAGGIPGNAVNARGPIMGPQSYEMVLRQAPNWLCAVYLGNLAHYTQQNDLIPFLQSFGYIVNFKLLPEKGCAFVTYDSHERAALAIVQLNGFTINGRPLKCGWGKSNKMVRPFNN